MGPESDAELVSRSLTDPDAFGPLFERHGATVLRFLLRRVPPADAEGLLGDTFRIAFERRATFDTQRSFRPWLYGIAANLVARHHRSETRRLEAMLRLAARSFEADHPADRAAGAVDASRAAGPLLDRLTGLRDGERQVVLLYAWEELTYEEMALALGIPIGTVRSRLSRARRRLAAPAGPAGRPVEHSVEHSVEHKETP